MTGFIEKNGILHAEKIALPDIAKKFGTPTYVYSADAIRQQYNALKTAMEKALPPDRQPKLCYACKANSNIAILKVLENLGSGLEIVSEGELFRGQKAGFNGSRMITTSFGKHPAEIEAYLNADLHQINIEAEAELDLINDTAAKLGKVADIAFRLNPNIAGGGHNKISTGRKEDKFGNTAEKIIELYDRASKMESVDPRGLAVHIGSQVTEVAAFKPAYEKLSELVKLLREKGHKVDRLDIGGGFPIVYKDEDLLDLDAYAQWVADIVLPLDVEIQMEPGRYMVGNAGVLLTNTAYIKETPSRQFLVLDAGMNDLIRPTLYEAYHGIRPVTNLDRDPVEYDVVGPICESGDVFTKGRSMPEVKQNELVVIQSAGAYGFAMASNYNSRPMPAEVLVDGDKVAIIRKRQTLDDIVNGENIPDWL